MKLHNLLFPQLADKNWAEINLNEWAKKLTLSPGSPNPLLNPEYCEKWVNNLHKQQGINFSYGGYMEDRSILWAGHYHQPDSMIHLGVDYNVPPTTHVTLPFDAALVCTEEDPDKVGGWGYRAIYKTKDCYVIFAHLEYVNGLVGSYYRKGHHVGSVGSHRVNGGWYPHLHVQCMQEYDLSVDGYGSSRWGLEQDYPNPELLVGE